MPFFYLQFEEACRALCTVVEHSGEYEALADSWRVFRKISGHLESGTGDRIENLARRLGYLQQAKGGMGNSRKVHDQNVNRTPSRASSAPRPLDFTKRSTSQRSILSNRAFSGTTGQKEASIQPHRTPFSHQFSGLDPISLLRTSRNSSSKPVIYLFIDIDRPAIALPPVPTSTTGPNHAFTTFYDNPNDPNELCILPSPLSAPPFSLDSIPELSDDELEHSPLIPHANSPVLFVNPFGQPHRNETEQHQLPSPPQTPSASDCIPPHLNDGEEDEESLAHSEPINLTGRIKKLIDPPIALGGTSDIFYGEWRLPVPKRVAVKVLRTTSTNSVTAVQRRLRREMRLWWMCRHRNVVPLYGYASDFGGMDSMISPWMKNGSALTYIKTRKSSWAERLKLLGDIVAGLKYLHHFQPPIIHGDLKPTNVLISDNGDACLCDFGLSRVIKSEAGPSGFTTSNFAGSIRYMSPELLNSEDEEALPLVTAASDVYALGCVGLEIVTDHTPYANRNLDAQVMHDIIRGIPPARRPSLVHAAASPSTGGTSGSTGRSSLPKFWDLITTMWAVEPVHRPDIVCVAKLLAECRTTGHVGPQLRTSTTTAMAMATQHMGSQVRAENALGVIANANHVATKSTSSGFLQRPSFGLGSRVSSPRSSSSSSSSSSVVPLRGSLSSRGRQEGVYRVPVPRSGSGPVTGMGVGAGIRSSSIGNSSFSQTTFASRLSASAGPARGPSPMPALVLTTKQAAVPSPSQSHLHLHPQHASPVPSSSSSSGGGGSVSGPTTMASDALHLLRRSTSAVLKGSLRKFPQRPTSAEASFRSSLDAAEQVWHDA